MTLARASYVSLVVFLGCGSSDTAGANGGAAAMGGTTSGAAGAISSVGGAGGKAGATSSVGGAAGNAGAATAGGGSGGVAGKGSAGLGGSAGASGAGASGGAPIGGAGGGKAGSASGGTSGNGGSAGATSAYPIVDPPSGFDGLAKSAPITVTKDGQVVSDVAIANPTGDCLVIDGHANVTVSHVAIGPCGGAAIRVSNGSSITITGSYLHDSVGPGVDVGGSNGVTVTGSHFARNASGMYALTSTKIVFEGNTVLNVQGPIPRGQLVQFDKVSGGGNRVRCNVGQNVLGKSTPEDALNFYQSNGAPNDPILVEGNRVLGGGPSMSGGGILLGDGGGSYITARKNVVVDPGQYGLGVPSGTHMTLTDNVVYGAAQSFTNVGVYVWEQYKLPCDAIEVSKNHVMFANAKGTPNPYWDGGGCGTVSGVDTNDFTSPVAPSVIDVTPSVCP